MYFVAVFLSKIDDKLEGTNEPLEWAIALFASMGIGLTLTGVAAYVWRVMP